MQLETPILSMRKRSQFHLSQDLLLSIQAHTQAQALNQLHMLVAIARFARIKTGNLLLICRFN